MARVQLRLFYSVGMENVTVAVKKNYRYNIGVTKSVIIVRWEYSSELFFNIKVKKLSSYILKTTLTAM